MAAIHCSHISAAASFSGKVHMWGMCRGQNVLVPMETRFGSLDDVFSCFASPACSWQAIHVTSKCRASYPGPIQSFSLLHGHTFLNIEKLGKGSESMLD